MSLRDASNPASLRRADLLKLLDLIVGLHETTDPAALPHRMMEAMLQLVPADAAGYSTIDLATGRATNDSTFGNPPEFVRAIERNMAQHPVIAHLRTHVEHQARAISDFTSPAAFQSLALYDELYRPMRVQDQIAIALKSGSTLQIGLTASRNAWGFSSRERLLFTLLRPHVLYCHENARRLTELKAQSDAWLYRLEQLPQGLAARDRGGRWLWITARARDMAQRFLPAARGEGGPVRDIIDRWASAQVARRERALGEPQALVLAGSDGHRRVIPCAVRGRLARRGAPRTLPFRPDRSRGGGDVLGVAWQDEQGDRRNARH
jgi:hypothetical protein